MNKLSYKISERIRFSDVDSMGVMWHGHYLRLLEEGREQFGLHYGLDYLKIFNEGFYTPIISSELKHHAPLKYGDIAQIESFYIYTKAAKIIFEYKIFTPNNTLAATGKTIQVFLNKSYNLEITNPLYYSLWKEKHFPNE